MPIIRAICIVTFSVFTICVSAQDISGVWSGKMTQDDGTDEYHVELEFRAQGDSIFGTSYYMNQKKPGEFATYKLRGAFHNSELYFQETELVVGPGSSAYDWCFIETSLDYFTEGGKEFLSGPWNALKGQYSCVPGDILLSRISFEDALETFAEKHSEELLAIETKEVINGVRFAEANVPIDIRGRSIRERTTIEVDEKTVLVEVWDNGLLDGDSISLNFNGQWVLSDHLLTKEKQKLELTFDAANPNNYLILYALNLGRNAPNTAAIAFTIDGRREVITLRSTLKSSEAINFTAIAK